MSIYQYRAMRHPILAVLLVHVMLIHGSCSTYVGKPPPPPPLLALVKPPRIENIQRKKKNSGRKLPVSGSKTLPMSQNRVVEGNNNIRRISNGIEESHQSNAAKWSLCDVLQGFLTWRFAQSQSLILGFLAFLFILHIPILGPHNPTSYLHGWIACGFVEGFFGDGDVESDSGVSIDILVMVILWGCLKSFQLAKARALAAEAIAVSKKRAEIADKRIINAPALMKVPAKIIVGIPPLSIIYKMAAE